MCMCVRTVHGALWEQCSVQFRSQQKRPGPGQSPSSGNPRVFRSPGPYLMGLSKKKVALSRAFLSHCLPLALLFPTFSHTTPPTPHSLEPLCEWVNSKCLLSGSAGPLYDALDIRWNPAEDSTALASCRCTSTMFSDSNCWSFYWL